MKHNFVLVYWLVDKPDSTNAMVVRATNVEQIERNLVDCLVKGDFLERPDAQAVKEDGSYFIKATDAEVDYKIEESPFKKDGQSKEV